MTHKCGPCGVSDESKKEKCPKIKKESGFSKTPCNTNKKTTPECHPSVKKFRSGNCKSSEEKQNCKCSSQDCHESYTKFQQNENCQQDKTEGDCSTTRFTQVRATDCTKLEEQEASPCAQPKTEPPCSNAFGKISSEKQKEACGKDSSIYSKITSTCKNLAKDFVKLKSSELTCPTEESSKYFLAEKQDLPPTTFPCPPKAEKGKVNLGIKACSCSKEYSGPCPDKKHASWADFFPMDARNEELKACIEKYSKIDPSQVISKCSQFANATTNSPDKCLKKTEERCVGAMPSTKVGLQKPLVQIPLKYRTLMGRWAPSAAIYLSSTALFTVYLTEWKPALRYIPLYSGYVQDLERAQGSSSA